MLRVSIVSMVMALAFATASVDGYAQTPDKYPNLKGQWVRTGGGQSPQWDPSKPPGRGQAAPLTPEYQALFEATLAKRGDAPQPASAAGCLPPGMPRSMIVYEPMEIIVLPDTTYIMLQYMNEFRRVFTDGRKFPDDLEPAYTGFSVGKWEDTDGDGKFDTLTIETRGMKGPRTFDGSGLPMHKDNETVVKEKIYLDKSNPDRLYNEITTTDHALTRPWTVTRSYDRQRDNPEWIEYVCAEDNRQVLIGEEAYTVSDDGLLMPTRKDQPAPDLRYFNQKK
jgi:hypothetical protein